MMNYRQKIGKYGEMLAKKYLIRHNYKIIDTNVKTGYPEIDIIAQKHKTTVFAEVKTRTSATLGAADESITTKKIKNLKKAMMQYIYKEKIDEKYIELDLISIDINLKNKIAKIKHYRNII